MVVTITKTFLHYRNRNSAKIDSDVYLPNVQVGNRNPQESTNFKSKQSLLHFCIFTLHWWPESSAAASPSVTFLNTSCKCRWRDQTRKPAYGREAGRSPGKTRCHQHFPHLRLHQTVRNVIVVVVKRTAVTLFPMLPKAVRCGWKENAAKGVWE